MSKIFGGDGFAQITGKFEPTTLTGESERMTELIPCPFCGGEAKLMDMGYPHWVYCTKCGAKVHGGTMDEGDSIKAWNRRAGDDLR